MADLPSWAGILACPLDHTPLQLTGENWFCPTCGFKPTTADIKGRTIPDFRAADKAQTVSLQFTIPHGPLDRYKLAREGFKGVNQSFDALSDAEFKQRFGTKLDRGMQYYCQQLYRERGADARILDLGCGNGGNTRYLESLGFKNILPVDWSATGAVLLADAHRLPLVDESVDMVISTAVFEHLYNPFLAMHEIARVTRTGGIFLGGASFWEAWHGSSYFHLTPDGWNALLRANNYTLDDLWTGWGIIPAALSHVLTPGHFRRLGYGLQKVVEGVYRLARGEDGVRRLRLRASGAYIVYAQKHSQPQG